jgi:NAD+ diphosphatase
MQFPMTEPSGFAYADAGVDRSDELRDDPDELAKLWPTAKLLVVDENGDAFAHADGTRFELTGSALGGGPGVAIFLGRVQGEAWFAIDSVLVPILPPRHIDLRSAATQWPEQESSLFAYARGMLYWHTRNRYCGVCGGEIVFGRAGFTGHCFRCKNDHYPRVDPAVIVAVSDGERLLLGRQPHWPERRYSVIAGFVEPGETLEQTVAREVFEETRVRVLRSGYLASQPWPFPGAMMLGFGAEAEPDPPRVNGELADARWFTRNEIGAALARDNDNGEGILLPPKLSIAYALIRYWYDRRSLMLQS